MSYEISVSVIVISAGPVSIHLKIGDVNATYASTRNKVLVVKDEGELSSSLARSLK